MLGALIAMLVALLVSSAKDGLDGLGPVIAAFALAVGFLAHLAVTTLVVLFAKRNWHVVAVHVVAPMISAVALVSTG